MIKKKYYYILILYYLYYDIILFVLLVKIIKICTVKKNSGKIKSNEKNKNSFKRKIIISDKRTLIEKVHKVRIKMS